MTDRGGLDTAELREALTVSRAIKAALSAFQTNAAFIISKTERHGDGGTGVLAETAGLSRRDARGQVHTAETISATPSVRDAVESGRVTEANARRLAEAVEKTSAEAVEADAGLLAKAETLRPEDFAKEARRWAADRQAMAVSASISGYAPSAACTSGTRMTARCGCTGSSIP